MGAEYLSDPPDVRELLRLSQSNVTRDPLAGLEYASDAYLRGLDSDVREADPTAASEGAAKAAFRGAQAGFALMTIEEWIRRANRVLPESPRGEREAISIDLLEGRALGLRALKLRLGKKVEDDEDDPLNAETFALDAFKNGDRRATAQHKPGEPWDPYGTMLSRHYATLAAVKIERATGDTRFAMQIARAGISRAIHARQEAANTPRGKLKHTLFVGKQAISNTMALGLAASRPLDIVPGTQWLRLHMAHWMLN